jgi:hypothetical protein
MLELSAITIVMVLGYAGTAAKLLFDDWRARRAGRAD